MKRWPIAVLAVTAAVAFALSGAAAAQDAQAVQMSRARQAITTAQASLDAAVQAGAVYNERGQRLLDHAGRELERATALYEKGQYQMALSHTRKATRMIADASSRGRGEK